MEKPAKIEDSNVEIIKPPKFVNFVDELPEESQNNDSPLDQMFANK